MIEELEDMTLQLEQKIENTLSKQVRAFWTSIIVAVGVFSGVVLWAGSIDSKVVTNHEEISNIKNINLPARVSVLEASLKRIEVDIRGIETAEKETKKTLDKILDEVIMLK